MGVGDGIATIGGMGILQRRSPNAVRGRVVASLGTVMNVGLVCSYLAAASILSVLGPRGTYVIGGIVASLALPFVFSTFHRSGAATSPNQPKSGDARS